MRHRRNSGCRRWPAGLAASTGVGRQQCHALSPSTGRPALSRGAPRRDEAEEPEIPVSKKPRARSITNPDAFQGLPPRLRASISLRTTVAEPCSRGPSPPERAQSRPPAAMWSLRSGSRSWMRLGRHAEPAMSSRRRASRRWLAPGFREAKLATARRASRRRPRRRPSASLRLCAMRPIPRSDDRRRSSTATSSGCPRAPRTTSGRQRVAGSANGRTEPYPVGSYAIRTYSGRPRSSIRFSR